nr:DNA translocase FtsK [Tumebacillus amylolyticus]
MKREFHPNLRDSNILVVWREDINFSHIAIGQVVPPLFRFMTNCDALILVSKPLWNGKLNEGEKAYHMDEALSMIEATDKWMDDSRPKLRTVQPVKIGFADVVKRHGAVEPTVKKFVTAVSQPLQMNLFKLLHEAERRQTQTYGGLHLVERESMYSVPSEHLFSEAAKVVMSVGRATVAVLQDELDVDYRTAYILMGQLQEAKFVGDMQGLSGREVLVTPDMLELYGQASAEAQ